MSNAVQLCIVNIIIRSHTSGKGMNQGLDNCLEILVDDRFSEDKNAVCF